MNWKTQEPLTAGTKPGPGAPALGTRTASPLGGLLPAVVFASLFAVFSSAPAVAQEDPFGAAPKPAAAPTKIEPIPDASKRDPLAIELLKSSNPAGAQELLRAAQISFQYGRPEEAKRYLTKLLAEKPADDVLAPLATRYGSFLLAASNAADLQPEGKQAADLVFSAAERTSQNAERIQAAIRELSAPDELVRQRAFQQLFAAGTAAVNPLLQTLADRGREAEHANIRAALVQLAATAEAPLVGALDTTDLQLKAQLVAVLGRSRSKLARPQFVRLALDRAQPPELKQLAAAALTQSTGAVPDVHEGRKYLRREIANLLKGDLPYPRDVDNRATLWSWDQAQQKIVPVRLADRDAASLLAARLTTDLAAIGPNNPADRRLMLLMNLDWAKTVAGLDRPLPIGPGTVGAMAVAAGAPVMNQVLADAIAERRVAAAIAAAEVLSAIGDSSVLLAPPDHASPLAQAVTDSDRRVRLAAALASVRLSPAEGYPGAGRVAETLARLAAGGGANAVLIGHPRGEEAQDMVGLMNALGYDSEAAYFGRALAERAFENPDFQFVLATDAIDTPPVEELVQWLRRDDRTAELPVAVLAREERMSVLTETMRGDRFTVVVPRVHSAEVAVATVERLKQIAGRRLVDRDERVAEAKAAVAALRELASVPGNYARLELVRLTRIVAQALEHPQLSVPAAALLGQIGTPAAQTALIEFASQNSRPLAARQAAAAAFAAAVKSRGLRLTQQQVVQQYARYNASEHLDAQTRAVLGAILDTIEGPERLAGQ